MKTIHVLFLVLLFTPPSASLAADLLTLPLGQIQYESHRIDENGKQFLNSTTQTISLEVFDSELVYSIHSVHTSASGETTVGRILARASDFELVHHSVRAATDSMSVLRNGDRITGWVAMPDQPVTLIDAEVSTAIPVDGPKPWLVSALPLERDFQTTIQRFNPWRGGGSEYTVRVVAESILYRGESSFECWVVDAGKLGPPGFRAKYWVDKSTRHVLHGELAGEAEFPRYETEVTSRIENRISTGLDFDETAIARASREFSAAYVRGDTTTIRELYTPDAILLPPGRELRGRAAIARYFAPVRGKTNLEHSMISESLQIQGDTAIDIGTWHYTSRRVDNDSVTTEGKYMVVWRRGDDGQWRIDVDMWHRPGQ